MELYKRRIVLNLGPDGLRRTVHGQSISNKRAGVGPDAVVTIGGKQKWTSAGSDQESKICARNKILHQTLEDSQSGKLTLISRYF